MNYILLMTSAGSLLFVGYLLLEKVMGEHMSQTGRFRMLVMVLFTYLVPWVWLRGIYESISSVFWQDSVAAMSGRVILGDAAIHATEELVVTPNYGFKLFAAGLWMTVAVLAMLIRCGIYFYSRHALLKHAQDCETDVPEGLILGLKREFRIRRRVRIVRIPDVKHSFTLGFLRPVVFLQGNCGEDELAYILRHECIHIARGDLLFKMLMELVCCLHWFNPLVYYLNHRLDGACEKACDERVVKDMQGDEREAYARLIIRSMKVPVKRSDRKVSFGSFFASSEKLTEERIRVIMNKRKRKFWEKIVVAGAFAALLFVDSLTAMAYPVAYNVEKASTKLARDSVQGEASLKRSVSEDAGAESDDSLLHDEQIVRADGEILPVQEQTRFLCFHKWEDAIYETHVRNDNGGCEVNDYSCTYCDRCKTIRIGELLYTIIYVTCPHD